MGGVEILHFPALDNLRAIRQVDPHHGKQRHQRANNKTEHFTLSIRLQPCARVLLQRIDSAISYTIAGRGREDHPPLVAMLRTSPPCTHQTNYPVTRRTLFPLPGTAVR